MISVVIMISGPPAINAIAFSRLINNLKMSKASLLEEEMLSILVEDGFWPFLKKRGGGYSTAYKFKYRWRASSFKIAHSPLTSRLWSRGESRS